MKFNYIISAYFGARKTYPNLSGEKLLDIHLDFFNKNHIEQVNRILIVLNSDKYEDIEKIQKIKEKYKELPIDFIIKDNVGGSYYNYQIAILNSLFLDPEIDYCFIIEDDYMPFDIEFYKPFINKLNENNNIFVCQKLMDYPKGKMHPGFSNGMFDIRKVKEFYKSNNELFNLNIQNNDYKTFCDNQMNFLDYLRVNYNIDDISENYSQPFYGESSIISNFGNINGDILIKPVVFDYYFFRKMKFTDLEFFLSIRNECYEFLHDNRKFTFNECKEWFLKNNPEYYIINYDNNDIGYFRISNYIKDSIYIGCDIHKDWRGKKLAYNAYIKFMNFIFNKYNVNQINLEVLSNNVVAYNLYQKIGFVETKSIDIFRNQKDIKSIFMSISKEDFLKRLKINFNCYFDTETNYRIYISSNIKVETNIFFYDMNDTRLWATHKFFEPDISYWFALSVDIHSYKEIKVVITDKHNNNLFEKIIKII